MRTAILSLMLISAVIVSGAGIYAATASSGYPAADDGYGVSSAER